jgi:Ca2+/Na+ antiporter
MQTTKEKLKWLKVDNQSFVLIINVLFPMLIIMLVFNFHTKKNDWKNTKQLGIVLPKPL